MVCWKYHNMQLPIEVGLTNSPNLNVKCINICWSRDFLYHVEVLISASSGFRAVKHLYEKDERILLDSDKQHLKANLFLLDEERTSSVLTIAVLSPYCSKFWNTNCGQERFSGMSTSVILLFRPIMASKLWRLNLTTWANRCKELIQQLLVLCRNPNEAWLYFACPLGVCLFSIICSFWGW